MKIVYFIAGGTYSGSNIALINFLVFLKTRKLVDPIVFMNKAGELCDKFNDNNIEYHVIRYNYSIFPITSTFIDYLLFPLKMTNTIIKNKKAKKRIVSLLKYKNVDIIHTNISPLQIGYIVAKELSVKHIWHIREYMDMYYNYTPLFSCTNYKRKLESEMNTTIYITSDLKEHFAQKDGNWRIISDGVKSEKYVAPLVEKENNFIYVGRIESGKGIAEVVSVFCTFSHKVSNYRLLILGNGTDEYVRKIKEISKGCNQTCSVEFLGFVRDVDKHIAKAKALIMASEYEGLGFTTIEAMFNNTLVIGKNSGGTKSIIDNNKYGLLYNTSDELLQAMFDICNDSNQIDTLENSKYVKNKYSIERNAANIHELYSQLCKKKIINID